MEKETRTHIARRKFQDWTCAAFILLTCGNAGAAALHTVPADSLAVAEKRDSITESMITADKYSAEETRS